MTDLEGIADKMKTFVCQTIAMALFVVFLFLGLLVSKFFYIGIGLVLLYLLFFVPLERMTNVMQEDKKKREMRERIRNIRNY